MIEHLVSAFHAGSHRSLSAQALRHTRTKERRSDGFPEPKATFGTMLTPDALGHRLFLGLDG